jgi:hypothetical protein
MISILRNAALVNLSGSVVERRCELSAVAAEMYAILRHFFAEYRRLRKVSGGFDCHVRRWQPVREKVYKEKKDEKKTVAVVWPIPGGGL